MGFFDDALRVGLGVGTLGLSEMAYYGPKSQREQGEQAARDIRGQQLDSKSRQLALLNQMQAPRTSPQMLARIAALEEEAKDRPLSQDPYFQGSRAQLVNGGRAAVADVQNVQKGYGIEGGFKNVGSVADIQDRLGGQLAQLGQQATQHRAQSRDLAAEARESIIDAQTAYENAVNQARIAIEAGDSAGAIEAIKMAYAARDAEAKGRQAALGQIYGTGATALGAIFGGPAGAMAGSNLGQLFKQNDYDTNLDQAIQPQYPANYSGYYPSNQQLFSLPNPIVNSPWAYQR